MVTRLIGSARNFFRKHPFIANSAIYGSFYAGAEYSQQYLMQRFKAVSVSDSNSETKSETVSESKSVTVTEGKVDIDYENVGRYAVIGTMIYAPSLYTWYKWLDGKFPGTARPIIIKKLVLDQFILTPYLLIVFYAGMALMERAEDPFLELREKFLPTFLRSCAFWLPAQTANFMLVAPRFRVVYMSVCGFIWVNILCWIKRQGIPQEAASVRAAKEEAILSAPTSDKKL